VHVTDQVTQITRNFTSQELGERVVKKLFILTPPLVPKEPTRKTSKVYRKKGLENVAVIALEVWKKYLEKVQARIVIPGSREDEVV